MNGNQNQGDDLRQHLHRRVDGLNDAPLTLQDIQGRARTIQRHRRLAGLASVAAAAALVVPVALFAGQGLNRGEGPAPLPATTSPSPTRATETQVPTPGLAYRLDREVHRADGTTFNPQVKGEIPYFAPLGDGRWAFGSYGVGSYGEDGFSVHVVNGTGQELTSYPALESGVATDRAGTSVAWVGRDGNPRVLQDGYAEPTVIPYDFSDFAGFQLLMVLGGDCQMEGCELLVETYSKSGEPTTYRVDQDGQGADFLAGTVLTVTDVSPDGTLVSAMTSVSDQSSCSAVVEIATATVRWETCEASTLRFSTDGSLVLGIDPYLDGIGHSLQVLFDADDGRELARHQVLIYDEAWVSPDSWWSVEGGGDTTSIMRYTWTGDRLAVEAVAGPEANDDSSGGSRYRLQAR